MIQFPDGLGAVGESVDQRLREFKRLHELSWGDELLFKEDGSPTTKQERGRLLNDQKANAIADMAAVLAGAGGGNKIWTREPGSGPASPRTSPARETTAGEERQLLDVVVYWENESLRDYAESWSANVSHQLLTERKSVPTEAEPAA